MSLGGDFLVGYVINPMIAYFLVGSLVFADPLVERDAFWITRPISGGQLLAAKAAGAFLMIVLFPVLVSLPWWIDCGLGAKGIALAAAHLGAGYLLLAAFGMGLRIGDGRLPEIPDVDDRRGFCVLAAPYMNIPTWKRRIPMGSATWGPNVFLTRVACGLGPWNIRIFCGSLLPPVRDPSALADGVDRGRGGRGRLRALRRLALGPDQPVGPREGRRGRSRGSHIGTGWPARRFTFAKNHVVKVPIAIDGAPANAAVKRMRAEAEWSIGPSLVWSAHGEYHDWRKDRMSAKALRSILGPAGRQAKSRRHSAFVVDVFMPFSEINAVRMKQEPASMHGQLEITLYSGAISGRLPLRDASASLDGRSYTVSGINVGPLNAKVARHLGIFNGPTEGNFVTLGLTERYGSGFGLGPLISPPNVWPGPYIMIVKPGSDRVCLAEVSAAGWVVATQLDGVTVVHRNVVFATPSTPGWLDDAEVVVITFGAERTIQRSFDAGSFEFSRASGNMTY